jgi:hypothetical protein
MLVAGRHNKQMGKTQIIKKILIHKPLCITGFFGAKGWFFEFKNGDFDRTSVEQN